MNASNVRYDDYRVEWAATVEGPSLQEWFREREAQGWRLDGSEPYAYFEGDSPVMRYRFVVPPQP